jgi:hypothetical protein
MVQKMQPNGTPYNTLERNLRRLGITMLVSTIYDLAIALLTLFWPTLIVQISNRTVHEPFYFLPLIHITFSCFCIPAWMDTKRNIVIVASAIIARSIYAGIVCALVLLGSLPPVIAVLGGISLLFAITHYILLRLSDFGLWEVVSRAGNPPGMRR